MSHAAISRVIWDGGREHEQPYPRGQVNHHLFPHDAAVAVAKIMGFVKHDQVGLEVLTRGHGIIELISQNLRGADDNAGIRVFLAVAGQDAHIILAELGAELMVFRV